jgi:hypothetical protein
VTVDLVVPVRVGGEPVVVTAVENDGRRVGDADPVLQGGEGVRRDEVATHRILQVGGPVDRHRVGDVAPVVGLGVLVDLDDAQARVVEVLGQPLRGHQVRCAAVHAMLLPVCSDDFATYERRHGGTSEDLPIRRGRPGVGSRVSDSVP